MKCEGPCEGVKWSYGRWSDCSATCGGGLQKRQGFCVDSDGKSLPQEKCSAIESVLAQECATKSCPKWETGDWTSVRDDPRMTSRKFGHFDLPPPLKSVLVKKANKFVSTKFQ